jgi:hypothetical protein
MTWEQLFRIPNCDSVLKVPSPAASLVLSGLIPGGTKRTKDFLYSSELNLALLDCQTYSRAKP